MDTPASTDTLASASCSNQAQRAHNFTSLVQDMYVLASEDVRVASMLRRLGELLVTISTANAIETNLSALVTDSTADEHSQSQPQRHHNGDAPTDTSAIEEHTFTPPIGPLSDDVAHSDFSEVPERSWQGTIAPSFEDLQESEARCRLKAEAARWTVERSSLLLADTTDLYEQIIPRDHALVGRARQISDCYLWMFERLAPTDDICQQYLILAGCYEAAAEAFALVCDVLALPTCSTETVRHMLQLAAEAQSALRVCVQALHRSADSDQTRLFLWLRAYSQEHRFLIERFMRVSNPADPVAWLDRCERLRMARESIHTLAERIRERKRLFNKARYHRKLIVESPSTDRLHDWTKVCEAVDLLITGGLPPSALDLRDLLLPLIDHIPETLELSSDVQRVLAAIDTYLASSSTSIPEDDSAEETAVVAEARSLLRGQSIILIGGDRRPFAESQICKALGLRNLIWIDTRSHQSHTVFEPYVARTDVVLVLLAIRWSSHSFSEVQAFCNRYDKLLVRLPGGYNANQVAYQIVNQAGKALHHLATSIQT